MCKDLTEFCLNYWQEIDCNDTKPQPKEKCEKQSNEPTDLEEINQQVFNLHWM